MKPRVWSESSIKDILVLAEYGGPAIATCNSPTDASRFRAAIYNYRRRNGITRPIRIRVSGCDVIVSTNITPPRSPLSIASASQRP